MRHTGAYLGIGIESVYTDYHRTAKSWFLRVSVCNTYGNTLTSLVIESRQEITPKHDAILHCIYAGILPADRKLKIRDGHLILFLQLTTLSRVSVRRLGRFQTGWDLPVYDLEWLEHQLKVCRDFGSRTCA